MKETDKEVVIRAEIPGFEENELDAQIDRDVLTIKAEHEKKDNGHEEYRTFVRSVALPAGIDAEHVQATYRNGVLELHIPRAEGSQPRHIKVQRQQDALASQAGVQSNKLAGAAASEKTKK